MTPQGYDDYKNVLTIPMNSALWIGNALVFKRETIKKSRAAVSSERNQFKKKSFWGMFSSEKSVLFILQGKIHISLKISSF